MGMKEKFVWYQQKIAKYDKQQWETRLEQREQRILYGLTHKQMRRTKPNTDLIDLDLVRGSSFTKAKPQHGFITVAKLATLRIILMPFYRKWWIQQTSKNVYICSQVLYLAQIVNIMVYILYISNDTQDIQALSCMEMLIPFIIMWVLSLIHSQIVATNPSNHDAKIQELNKSRFRRKRNVRKVLKERSLDVINSDIIKPDRKRTVKKLKFNDVVNIGRPLLHQSRSQIGLTRNVDDDGFESLNGNGSRTSEEEIVPVKLSQSTSSHNENKKTEEALDANKIEEKVQFEKNDFEKEECQSKEKCESWVQQITDTNLDENEEVNKEIPTEIIKIKKIISTDSDSERESDREFNTRKPIMVKRRNSHIPVIKLATMLESTCDEDDILSSPETANSMANLAETSSATEWMGVTTNSEDCSYSSDIDNVSEPPLDNDYDYMTYDNDMAPTAILNPPSEKVSCIIWERNEIKKADLSMLEISSAIICKVDNMPESMDYFYVGMVISAILGLLPILCRTFNYYNESESSIFEEFFLIKIYRNVTNHYHIGNSSLLDLYKDVMNEVPSLLNENLAIGFGNSIWEHTLITIVLFQRWILAGMVFFLLSVAERTFKQRLLYAKLFSHLTSSRRARKSDLPHFRLNKVRNIKTWLSVRSYLKKRGPQRSVDVIVSTAFVVCLLLLTFLCVELLKETINFSQYYLEALTWSLGLGILLLRFMTLGTKINKKYRNLSVLITEQINLHLQIEQKPHKKEELNVANNVLKLAIDLLKELESPFKISGLSANPILYNITKLVILSALSGVLSEMLGFKLKLHKIKIK